MKVTIHYGSSAFAMEICMQPMLTLLRMFEKYKNLKCSVIYFWKNLSFNLSHKNLTFFIQNYGHSIKTMLQWTYTPM